MKIGQGSTIQGGFDSAWSVSGTPTFNITHKSESLSYIADKKEEESLVGGRASRGVQTLGAKVEGDISFAAKPDEIGALVAWTTGHELSTAMVDSSVAYKHTFEPMQDASDSAPKVSIQIDRKIGVYEYTSCKVDSFKLSGAPNGFVEGSITLRGYDEATGSLEAGVTKSSLKAFKFTDADISIDGADFGDYVQSFDFEYSNSLESDLYVLSSGARMGEIEFGKLAVSGSLEMLVDSATALMHENKFKTDTNVNLVITLISAEEIEAGYPYSITIKIPVAQIMDSKFNLSGADRIKHTMNFTGLEDNTNKAVTIEVIDAKETAYI